MELVVLILALSFVSSLIFSLRAISSLKGEIALFSSRIVDIQSDIKFLEKQADRAYTMASTANISVAIQQKQMSQPVQMTAEQQAKHDLSKLQAETFQMASENSFLEPLLSEEQLESLEKIRKQKQAELNKIILNGAVS